MIRGEREVYDETHDWRPRGPHPAGGGLRALYRRPHPRADHHHRPDHGLRLPQHGRPDHVQPLHLSHRTFWISIGLFLVGAVIAFWGGIFSLILVGPAVPVAGPDHLRPDLGLVPGPLDPGRHRARPGGALSPALRPDVLKTPNASPAPRGRSEAAQRCTSSLRTILE